MKRNVGVSVLCALLFTNILANAKDIEELISKCSHSDQKACRELEAAVRKLTDQALLAKIAVESTDAIARQAAVEKLTDQTALGKITVESKEWRVREVAVGKLTDQALLGKIADQAADPDVRFIAIGKLTDQALLGEIAVKDNVAYVRQAAQKRLAQIRVNAK